MSFTITYSGNGNLSGTPPVDANSYNAGDPVTILGSSTLALTNFYFYGWNTAADGGGTTYLPNDIFTINSNTTLYAFWKPNSCQIMYYSFLPLISGMLPKDNSVYKIGDIATIFGNIGDVSVTGGLIFAGWNTAADGSGTTYQPGSTITIQNVSTSLYAMWSPPIKISYVSTLQTSGIVPVDNNNYLPTSQIPVMQNVGNLVRTNYIFSGWNTAADGSGTTYQPGQNIVSGVSVVLYPLWTAVPLGITYIYSESSGSAPTDSTVYQLGQTATVLAPFNSPFTSDGRMFTSWNTSPDGSGTYYLPNMPLVMNQAIILYAMFAPVSELPQYRITYDANTSVLESGFVPVDTNVYQQNSVATILNNINGMNKIGYTFSGWNTKPDGSGNTYLPGSTITVFYENVTLYAIWKPSFSVSYQGSAVNSAVTFTPDSNLYGLNQAATVAAWNTSSVPVGFSVSGWNTASDGSGVMYQPGEQIVIKGNITLYLIVAQLTPVTYTITYNINGGDAGQVPAPAQFSGYTNIPVPGTVAYGTGFTKTGTDFTSWNTAPDGSGKSYNGSSNISLTGNITLYAIWTNVLNLPVSKVVYNSGVVLGQPTTDLNSYPQYAIVCVLDIQQTNPGYKFSGWNTASNGSGTTYKPGDVFAMGTTNVNLYAIWIPQLTLTYSSYFQTVVPVDSNVYYPGDTVKVQGPPTYTGLAFIGWNTASDGSGTTYQPGQDIVLNSSVTLTALWVPGTYSITYDPNGAPEGSQPIDIKLYAQNAAITILGGTPSMINGGYVFVGWNTKPDNSGTFYLPNQSSIFPTQSNLTLYAIWCWEKTYGRVMIWNPTTNTFTKFQDFSMERMYSPGGTLGVDMEIVDAKIVKLDQYEEIPKIAMLCVAPDKSFSVISEITLLNGSITDENVVMTSTYSQEKMDVEGILKIAGGDSNKATWNSFSEIFSYANAPIPTNPPHDGILGYQNLANSMTIHRLFNRNGNGFLSIGPTGSDDVSVPFTQFMDMISPRQPYNPSNTTLQQLHSNIIFKPLFLVKDNLVGVILGKNDNNFVSTTNIFPYLVYRDLAGTYIRLVRGSPILLSAKETIYPQSNYTFEEAIDFNNGNVYDIISDLTGISSSIIVMEDRNFNRNIEILERNTDNQVEIFFREAFVSDEVVPPGLDLSGSVQMISTNLGLFYSNDGGNTWTLQSVTKGLPSAQVNASMISVTQLGYNPQGNEIIQGTTFISTSAGIFASSDGGLTWVKVSNVLVSSGINSIATN